MKRVFTVIIVLLVIVGGVMLFNVLNKAEPPTPEIRAGNQSVPTTQGSYCWEGIMFAQCVDMAFTHEEIAKRSSTTVSPGEKIRIKFRKEPLKDTLLVQQYDNQKDTGEIQLEKGSFTAPKEKGIYVYTVHGRWDRGSGGYFFTIEVK